MFRDTPKTASVVRRSYRDQWYWSCTAPEFLIGLQKLLNLRKVNIRISVVRFQSEGTDIGHESRYSSLHHLRFRRPARFPTDVHT